MLTIGAALAALSMIWAVPQPPLANAYALERGREWTDHVFEVRDHGRGLYIAVDGSAEFDRATILFGDGSRMDLDLLSARRGAGLYALADFTGDREVACVGLRMRARSSTARVGIRLGREDDGE